MDHIFDVDAKSPPSIESIPVVLELKEMFPTNFPCMPPNRYIDFCINLELDTHPISISPYRVGTTKLRELKAQIHDLLNKGFIRPSPSLWGVPVLYVKKKSGSMRICIDY